MSAVKFHKVVGSLPGTLEANSVYFLRTGAGFSIHITNDLGQVEAYNLNTSSVAPESNAYWDFVYDGDDVSIINKWSDNTKTEHLLNKGYIEDLLINHRIGKIDYSRKIWTALTFMVWHRIYVEESQEFLTEPLQSSVQQ